LAADELWPPVVLEPVLSMLRPVVLEPELVNPVSEPEYPDWL